MLKKKVNAKLFAYKRKSFVDKVSEVFSAKTPKMFLTISYSISKSTHLIHVLSIKDLSHSAKPKDNPKQLRGRGTPKNHKSLSRRKNMQGK